MCNFRAVPLKGKVTLPLPFFLPSGCHVVMEVMRVNPREAEQKTEEVQQKSWVPEDFHGAELLHSLGLLHEKETNFRLV